MPAPSPAVQQADNQVGGTTARSQAAVWESNTTQHNSHGQRDNS